MLIELNFILGVTQNAFKKCYILFTREGQFPPPATPMEWLQNIAFLCAGTVLPQSQLKEHQCNCA